jgi:hypothetical protein
MNSSNANAGLPIYVFVLIGVGALICLFIVGVVVFIVTFKLTRRPQQQSTLPHPATPSYGRASTMTSPTSYATGSSSGGGGGGTFDASVTPYSNNSQVYNLSS